MRNLSRALALVAAAIACAAISNAFAGSERKLLWTGSIEASSSAKSPTRQSRYGDGAASEDKPSKADGSSSVASAKGEFSPHPDKPWVEISGADVAALHARGDVPFLDARRTSVYRDGHIAGARPFAVWEADVDDKVKGFFGEGHDSNAPIVVYCSGGDCEDSHTLGQKLFFAGFNNVLVYKDGYPDWVRRGLAVSKGEKP